MTSFITGIATDLLLALIALVVVMAVYCVEAAAYYRFAAWYYRTGPAIIRERWQTTATAAEIREAIRPLLAANKLVGRESSDGFHFRQRTATINAWTRFVLRIEEAERGAVLHYEARPFYSFVPMIIPIAWLDAAIFGTGRITVLSLAGPIAAAVVFIIYKWILPWDVSRMARLPTVRKALSPHGLHVCEQCGYDLFGHTNTNRCPECGHSARNDNREPRAHNGGLRSTLILTSVAPTYTSAVVLIFTLGVALVGLLISIYIR